MNTTRTSQSALKGKRNRYQSVVSHVRYALKPGDDISCMAVMLVVAKWRQNFTRDMVKQALGVTYAVAAKNKTGTEQRSISEVPR